MTFWKQFAVVSVSLIVSLVVTFIPTWTGNPFSTAEQVILGVDIFSAFILVDVLLLIRSIAVRERREREHWLNETELDDALGAVRGHFAAIARKRHGADDLFVAHFKRDVAALVEDIRKAAQLDELWVGNHHFGSVDKVMSAFLGERNALHRSVWLLRPGERLFDLQADLEYFRLLTEAAGSRKLKAVHTLCVLESHDDDKDCRIRALLDYYKMQPRFVCRLVPASEYEKARADAELSPDFVDFGIYGTRQMFLTACYEPERKGVFVRNQGEVKRYTEFFDTIWQSQTVRENPSIAKKRIVLKDLVTIDDNGAREDVA